jgi:hypothetical protein
MTPLAYMTAKTNGLDHLAQQILDEAGLSPGFATRSSREGAVKERLGDADVGPVVVERLRDDGGRRPA